MAIDNFYVAPAGDMSGGLAGLGAILQHATEQRQVREAEEEQRQKQAEAQAALLDAWRSGDPSQMMEASITHPMISAQATQGLGLLQDYQKREATEFATAVLANPERAGELAERRLQLLNLQGRNSADTQRFYDSYLQDPESAINGLKMNFAAFNPEAFKAYQEAADAGDFESKVVGDFLVNAQTGEVLFDGTGGGTAEHGVTPLVFRNPESGKYSAYLPAKDGTITEVPIPEGQEFVPDSGRMGYNPTNILERSAAETTAERLKQLPAQTRALLRRQQQATLLDDTIDRISQQAGGFTTGFTGSILSALPGTEAFDLKKNVETLRANIGFDKLQEMREQSPTGGALGPVSDFENRNLQSVLGNLEQSQSLEQFQFNLEQVRNVLRDIVHGSEMQFIDTFGAPQTVDGGSAGTVLRFDADGNPIP